MLYQRSWVQFPAPPIDSSQLSVTVVLWHLMPSSGAQMHMQTKHPTHVHKIHEQINLFKERFKSSQILSIVVIVFTEHCYTSSTDLKASHTVSPREPSIWSSLTIASYKEAQRLSRSPHTTQSTSKKYMHTCQLDSTTRTNAHYTYLLPFLTKFCITLAHAHTFNEYKN